MDQQKIKATIIDLYNNEENEGMRCIRDILNEVDCKFSNISLEYDIHDARYKDEVPNLDYDIYISSGGPGSPFEDEGSDWERRYFNLLDDIRTHNLKSERKKYVFFICHSFQIMARYFKFGEVTKRHSKSFGIMPVHKFGTGFNDPLLNGLPSIFYAADFRDFQVIQPDESILSDLGAEIICLEKERPHVDFERAIMAVRISDEIVGTQFHPEADPASMYYHFRKPERKEHIISKYSEEKYHDMLDLLEDPKAIKLTRSIVLPGFVSNAVKKLTGKLQEV